MYGTDLIFSLLCNSFSYQPTFPCEKELKCLEKGVECELTNIYFYCYYLIYSTIKRIAWDFSMIMEGLQYIYCVWASMPVKKQIWKVGEWMRHIKKAFGCLLSSFILQFSWHSHPLLVFMPKMFLLLDSPREKLKSNERKKTLSKNEG